MFSAIQASNEDGHRLIRRPRLHLIIRALPLMAPVTLEDIRRHGTIALELPLLPHLLIIELRLPTRRIQLVLVHLGKVLYLNLAALESVKQLRIPDVGLVAEIAGNLLGVHFVHVGEEGKGPRPDEALGLRTLDRSIIDTGLQLQDL